MRKLLAAILSITMVFSLAACGKKNDTDKNNTTLTPGATAPAQDDKAAVIAPEVKENTAGSALWNEFLSTMTENPETTALDMADKLSTNPVIEFMAGATEVELGYLAGFSEEIRDFEKAATHGPMIGSIAFAGYVFELAEDADVKAFIENLKSKSDPRWNICVEADYTQVGAYGNTVYFLMYPEYMDENSEGSGEDNGNTDGEADVISPEVAENTWGKTLWESFETIMKEEPSAAAIDVAFALSADESIKFMSGASEVEPGSLSGFTADIEGFRSGATFGPMMDSIAFLGYVFELEDGANVEEFMSMLKTNSNPSWNDGAEADQTVTGAYNNTVFFLMCPSSGQGE